MESPKIYVASLSDYNNGRLEGKWFDFDDYENGSELMRAIYDMLDEISKKYDDGEVREEWAVHDYEYIPSSLASEYMGESDFDVIYEIKEVAEEYNIPMEVLMERVGDLGSDDYQNIAESLTMVVDGNDTTDIVYEIEEQFGDLGNDFWNNYIYVDEVTKRVMYSEDVDRFREDILEENPDMDENEVEVLAEEMANEEEQRRDDDLVGYLEELGYQEIPNWVSKDYEDAWKYALSYDYDVIYHDGKMYVFSNNYSFGGGVALGSLIGGYLGYKIGRAVGTRKGGTFDTEKKIGRGIKSAFTKKKYAEGGRIDLFEDYENIPSNVQEILNEYELEDNSYDVLDELLNRLEAVGYTFSYGLDAEPYGLRPIGVNLNELKGYEDEEDDDKMAKGGGVRKNKSKGGIGKSGTQYGYTLEEWEKMALNKGLLVSPKEWWKSQKGKSYTDSFGRKKKIGQYSQDEKQSMEMYGYLIANGLDLGSQIIPYSAKKYVEQNNYMKYAEGGWVNVSPFHPMDRYNKIRHFMLSLGFEVDDIQPPDNSVGLSNGWVTFNKTNDKTKALYEIDYDDLTYYIHHNGSREDIFKDSFLVDEDEYARGGMTEHGLEVGDTIIEDFGDDEIGVRSSNRDFHRINLDKGKRYEQGGSVEDEIANIEDRIYNIEQLKMVASEEDMPYYNRLISNLEQEKMNLLYPQSKPKKRFGFFEDGGNIDDLVYG